MSSPSTTTEALPAGSGARTAGKVARLTAAAPKCETYILEGGIDAWKEAGLPVAFGRGQPIHLLRQMQIKASRLLLLGIPLGTWVNMDFNAFSAFVGAWLVFAGVRRVCPKVRLLKLVPWCLGALAPAK